jgi:acetyl esterase/lipase
MGVGQMKHLYIILIPLALGIISCTGQPYSTNWENINYADDNLVSHNLDIYLPRDNKPRYPAVMIVYGSAFFGNDMKQNAYKALGAPLLDSGFAVVTVNHRSSRDAIFPAQIQDIKAAVRFLKAKGHKFQIDTSFIGITGYSSGGHLSAMMGTSGFVNLVTINSKTAHIEGNIGNYASYNSSVNAVVDWFGPIDFQSMDSCGSSMVHDAPDSPESILIGAPIQDNDDLCALANPISYVDPDDPPFLILHGDADPLVPHCQSALLFQSLQEAGVASQFVLVPEAAHGPGLFEEEYFRMMTDFFLRCLVENKEP